MSDGCLIHHLLHDGCNSCLRSEVRRLRERVLSLEAAPRLLLTAAQDALGALLDRDTAWTPAGEPYRAGLLTAICEARGISPGKLLAEYRKRAEAQGSEG